MKGDDSTIELNNQTENPEINHNSPKTIMKGDDSTINTLDESSV